MNICSEIFSTDGSNSSDYIFYSGDNKKKITLEKFAVVSIVTILLGFPINSYVIWLIVRGTGNGIAAEFFSLNFAACEIFICMESVMGVISYKFVVVWRLVGFLQALDLIVRPLFQCLICVERYLAVVHPVTFLKYKPLRYRVICSGIVWVLGLAFGGVSFVNSSIFLFFLLLAQFFLFLSIQMFCLVAVLRALKQSGPGERGRKREEGNHMKRRAFYLILISNVSMVAIYIPYILSLYISWTSSVNNDEFIVFVHVFFNAAALVQPFLFLYRVGKFPFIKFFKKKKLKLILKT